MEFQDWTNERKHTSDVYHDNLSWCLWTGPWNRFRRGLLLAAIFRISGDLSINNLQGSSVRNLVVDENGTIQAQEFSGYAGVYSVTMYDFVSWANPGDDHNAREFFGTMHHESVGVGVETLIAPLHLPQGAKIKEITIYYRDEHMSDSIQFELVRSSYMSPGIGGWMRDTIGTSTYSTGVQMLQASFDYPIDNSSHMHYIYVGNPNGANSWPGQEVGVIGAIIRYDL